MAAGGESLGRDRGTSYGDKGIFCLDIYLWDCLDDDLRPGHLRVPVIVNYILTSKYGKDKYAMSIGAFTEAQRVTYVMLPSQI